jgi:tetratricopeptide (TPR) repeat protein
MYHKATIDELVEQLQDNIANKRKCALIIGAGVSASAGIPTADGFIKKIQKTYPQKCASQRPQGYTAHMKMLTPIQRKELINSSIANAQLNMAHLYLAQLIKAGYIDRVLTTNFDPLVSQALATENIFPGIYDFAASQEFRPDDTADIAIFHLHGQKDGYNLLHTDDEVNTIFEKSKALFEATLRDRTILVVGYSGENDPIFRHLESMKRFERSLYWIGYQDCEPATKVLAGILDTSQEKYAYHIGNYTADKFFIELVNKLEVERPRIIGKPFSILLEMANNIAPYSEDLADNQDRKSTDPVQETKKWIQEAIDKYENGQTVPCLEASTARYQEEELVKLARETWINNILENDRILEARITESSSADAKQYYAYFLNNCGIDLGNWGGTRKGAEADKIYSEAFEKFKRAWEIKPDDHDVLNNWGIYLDKWAATKGGAKADAIYKEAFEKFKLALDIKPDFHEAWYNWGNALGELAKKKEGQAAMDLFAQALDVLEQGEKIQPYSCLYNMACNQALTGDTDKAVQSLVSVLQSGHAPNKEHIVNDSGLQSIVQDARVQEALQNI